MKRPRRFDPSKHDVAPNPIAELSTAAATGWCWTLVKEPDGRWTLRHRDWLTDAVSEPIHTSSEPLANYHEAMAWAKQHGVDLIQWTGWLVDGENVILTDAAFRWIKMIVDRTKLADAA